jgi:hypothetical protein
MLKAGQFRLPWGMTQALHVCAGINSARKGWLTKENVLNTRGLAAVRKLLSE